MFPSVQVNISADMNIRILFSLRNNVNKAKEKDRRLFAQYETSEKCQVLFI